MEKFCTKARPADSLPSSNFVGCRL